MDTIIYRKSDWLIAGTVFPRRSSQKTENAMAVETDNIRQSELGGIPDDYTLVENETASQPGFQTVINDDGSVGFTPIPPGHHRVRIAELPGIPWSSWTTSQ